MVEKFIKMGRHERHSRLFRRILKTGKRMQLRKEPMSYSRANELIKQELQKERVDPGFYGIHSLRAGGAYRLFQRQGGREDGAVRSQKK